MKTIRFMVFFLIALTFGNILNLNSQVTIGQNEAPEKYATLQIKDIAIDRTGNLDTPTAEKGGLLLPRVELKKKKELLPFATLAEVEANPQPQDYLDAKKLHIGLIVYNMNEDDDEELCIGINQWDGEQWNCLQNKLGNAVATIKDCQTLRFVGQYQNEVALGGSNFLSIDLTVTKAGAYTITAMPDPQNGYYFTLTGVFMATGDYTLTIPGTGTPIDFTPSGENGDLIKITFNGKSMDSCDPLYLKIEDSSKKPMYSMRCNSVKVNGVYRLNKPLVEDEHTITLTLEVDPQAFGATYIIETNTVEGISFRAEGLLSQAIQPVTLQPVDGSVPTSVTSKQMIISTNSTTTVATCYTTVPIALTKKKIVSIGGYATTFGYQFGSPNLSARPVGDAQSSKMITSKQNFGILSTSIVRVEDLEVNTATDINEYYRYRPDNAQLQADLFNADGSINADIVILGVYWEPNTTQCQLLTEYLAKGGILLCFMEYGGTLELVRTIFSDRTITGAATNAAGAIYQLPYLEDEILNGPFGDIRGKQWGEDASLTYCLYGLPSGLITQYSTNDDKSQVSSPSNIGVTAFRHKELNFIWVGDGGFNSGNSTTIAGSTICPFKVNESNGNVPVARNAYGRGVGSANRYDVYNSVFTANAIAWGLKKAQEREDNLK